MLILHFLYHTNELRYNNIFCRFFVAAHQLAMISTRMFLTVVWGGVLLLGAAQGQDVAMGRCRNYQTDANFNEAYIRQVGLRRWQVLTPVRL